MIEKEKEGGNSIKIDDPEEIKPLFAWTAPGRPFKKRTKQFYMVSILLALPFIILSVLVHEPVGIVIVAFLFVAFTLNTIPPKDFQYKITHGGITIEDHFFLWQELYDFYFKNRFDNIEVLHIRTHAFLPGEITLTLGEFDKEPVKKILMHYLPYREIITPTFVDKSAHWLTKNFPLENTKTKSTPQKVAS